MNSAVAPPISPVGQDAQDLDQLCVNAIRTLHARAMLLIAEAARAAGMKSIGVSQNCQLLPADVVVRSLDLLEA